MGKLKPTYDVGFIGTSKDGVRYQVISYNGRKSILIEFTDGKTKTVTSTDIKMSNISHHSRKVSKVCVGYKSVSKDFIPFEIVKIDNERCDIKFEDGFVKSYSLKSVKSLDVLRKSNVSVGDVFKTNNHGIVEVIAYRSADDIDIVFEDGVISTTQASQLKRGNIGHPYSGLSFEKVYENRLGFKFKIKQYHTPLNVDIEWECGNTSEGVMATNIRNKRVYYPLCKDVCGVGYFGFGKYKPNKGGQGSNYNERVYASWQRMIRRCYDEKEQLKPSSKAYKGVKVCNDWHCFQNFAEWAESRFDRFIEGWELDKDMFGDGLTYSPETCTLLPEELNSFLCNKYQNKVADLPEGVNLIKPKTANSKVGYTARCCIENIRTYLGYYDSVEEAANVYRLHKEQEARRLAHKYKNVLSNEEYTKMLNFKIEDIHRK